MHSDPPSAALRDAIRARLDLESAEDRFAGAVLVARGGHELLCEARGPACRSLRVVCHERTRFNLGSMNKMFTAVALARLVERGHLHWSDPLAERLDSTWVQSEAARRVTLEQLAAHTSGLGDYFTPEFISASRLRFRTVADYRPLVADQAPAFEPGSAWRYSNVGYLMLGATIERICGRDFGECLNELVFAPCGMAETGCFDVDGDTPDLAVGYSRLPEGGWRSNLFAHVVRGGPAGGGFSTVGDLLKFDRALRGGGLLSRASLDRLWTPTDQSIAAGKPYGMGFRVRDAAGGRVVGHTGVFAGLSTVLAMHIDSDWTIVVLACVDGAGPALCAWIEEQLAAMAGRESAGGAA